MASRESSNCATLRAPMRARAAEPTLQVFKTAADEIEAGGHLFRKGGTCSGRRYAAARAVEQADTETRLQRLHAMTGRRYRDVKLIGSLPETAVPENCQENDQVGKLVRFDAILKRSAITHLSPVTRSVLFQVAQDFGARPFLRQTILLAGKTRNREPAGISGGSLANLWTRDVPSSA